MTFRFSKKESITLVLLVLLTVTSILGGYYLYLDPKNNKIETQKSALKAEQEVLTALQKQKQAESSITAESIAALQQKVPVKPQLEQIILDLEKAEVLSGSVIKNMSFTETDVAQPEAAAPPENNEAAEGNENKEGTENTEKNQNANEQENDQNNEESDESNNDTTNQNNASNAENIAKYVPAPLPAGVKKLTVTLQVESSNYDELRGFIEALEALPRTIVVETVSFSGTPEVTELDVAKKEEPLAYSLTLSAFFMPALTDLADKLPELVVPPSANKTTPFNRFPDL